MAPRQEAPVAAGRLRARKEDLPLQHGLPKGRVPVAWVVPQVLLATRLKGVLKQKRKSIDLGCSRSSGSSGCLVKGFPFPILGVFQRSENFLRKVLEAPTCSE